jgi:hypothetical protein
MATVKFRFGSDAPDGARAVIEFSARDTVRKGLFAFIRVHLRFQILASVCRAVNMATILTATTLPQAAAAIPHRRQSL